MDEYINLLPEYIKGPFFDFDFSEINYDIIRFKFMYKDNIYQAVTNPDNDSYRIEHISLINKNYIMGEVYFRK